MRTEVIKKKKKKEKSQTLILEILIQPVSSLSQAVISLLNINSFFFFLFYIIVQLAQNIKAYFILDLTVLNRWHPRIYFTSDKIS